MNANITSIFTGTVDSMRSRIHPSGFMATSIQQSAYGTRSMFVRDTAAMLIALLELGVDSDLPRIHSVLEFMLGNMQELPHAAHVLYSDQTFSKIISFDMADQTDGTMHVACIFAQYTLLTKNLTFGARHYSTVARFLNHYLAPEATSHAGYAYFNATLGLIFNPNFEHSRDGHYWSDYDSLTNTFATEALRLCAQVAEQLGDKPQAMAWLSMRDELVRGINTSLVEHHPNKQTYGEDGIYAELYGHVHFWWPGSNDTYPPGNSTGSDPLLWGMSFVQSGVIGAFAASVGRMETAPADTGLNVERMDNTLAAYKSLGSFTWIPDNTDATALMSLTHINASTYTEPDRAVIGKGLGWEMAWAGYRHNWNRVLVLHRWLAAAAVNNTLYAESYVYDCLREHHSTGCWGDMGNGEQAGWFVWGQGVVRHALGI